MVPYNPKVWFSMIFHAYSRGVMRLLTPTLIGMAIYSTLLCYVLLEVVHFHKSEFSTTFSMHSLLGIVLGLFLVFRTNSSYDRWWEGRKLWGALVNSTRNMALKLDAYLDRDDIETRQWFAQMIPNFIIATKESLRKGVNTTDLDIPDNTFLERVERAQHVPNIVSSMMYKRINQLYEKKKLTGEHMFLLDKEQKELVDFMGSCERIKNTPIPYSYSMYIKQFIFIYIVTLPFAFVTTTGYITIPIVLLITFVLMSVELIAEEIEDPFGRDINDLPTDELAVKIKANVREILL